MFALLHSPSGSARLHAYYVVQNVSLGGITPRILFVLDTSGSMAWRAQVTQIWCRGQECEDAEEGNLQNLSRIAAARRAIHQVVSEYKDQARFSLMSFSRHGAPEKMAEIPDDCAGGSASVVSGFPRGTPRFVWSAGYEDPIYWPADYNGWFFDVETPAVTSRYWSFYGSQDRWADRHQQTVGVADSYTEFTDYALFPYFDDLMPAPFHGSRRSLPFAKFDNDAKGTWRLCGDNRPFPYIRWDDINDGAGGPSGTASVLPLSNNSGADYGPGPLLTAAELRNDGNRFRRVQWFPRFMGTRVNLDHTDLRDLQDLCMSFGDYGKRQKNNADTCFEGNNLGTLPNRVSNQDFYYWPYVDGFPGYSFNYSIDMPDFDTEYAGVSATDRADYEQMWVDVLGDVCSDYGGGAGCRAFAPGINTGVYRFSGARSGVQREPDNAINDKSELFVPFYQPGVVAGLNDGSIKYDEWYPMSSEEASQAVMNMTDRMRSGGMDVAGSTPWLNAIGETNSSVPVVANSPFSNGGTISKYIEWVRTVEPADRCSPIATVLITDGEPSDPSGGSLSAANWRKLNKRLAGLRDDRETKVYVVGFFIDPNSSNPAGNASINDMACAGTGAGDADDTNPCTADASDAHNFDTCRDPSDPANDCAFLADSPEELALVLSQIVEGELAMDVPAGTGASINTFGTTGGGSGGITQTNVSARTEWPAWKGHVERTLCTDTVPDPANPNGPEILAPYCQNANIELDEDFGACDKSREWDAGECLAMTDWDDRNIFITDASNNIHPIYDGTEATDAFVTELNSPDLGIPGAPNWDKGAATLLARFIMGEGWKDGWKLPGLAASSPMVVRRIPKPDPLYAPSVGIRDPHCSGRLLASPEEVDPDLVQFAEDAWDPSLKLTGGYASHYEYQEAVLVGDDLGLLHAFQLDSGNEMWALLPRFSLASAVESFTYGGEEMGQPGKLEEHVYGVSGTANLGWVWDKYASKWRHLAVIGMGEGGDQYIAMDVSHMSPASADGPVEVLWTTNDTGLKATYGAGLGETWARPALTFHADTLSERPDPFLVFGSGYADSVGPGVRGRMMYVADAMTGEMLKEAELPPAPANVYEPLFGAVVDPAVGTHCVSRFWGEAQETYIADPAGRLFRWDLGRKADPSDEGEADSGTGAWADNGDVAQPVATFSACEGAGGAPCAISGSHNNDPFLFSPAVVSLNRIDDIPGSSGQGIGAEDQDQFLVAMVSGSPYDDTLDANDTSINFHPSLYLMVDDHRGTNKHGGFDITTTTGRVAAGTESGFMREVLTDMSRTRRFLPYPTFNGSTDCPNGATWNASISMCEKTAPFSKRTRPIRAPRISVTGLNKLTGCSDVNDPSSCSNVAVEAGIEMYAVEYTVFESGTGSCDEGWYDPVEETWHFDQGATYTIRYSLAVNDASGFDLANGAGLGYLTDGGKLTALGVQQVLSNDCADGNCGPVPGVPSRPPCDPNNYQPPADVTYTIPLSTTELEGFSRLESARPTPPVTAP